MTCVEILGAYFACRSQPGVEVQFLTRVDGQIYTSHFAGIEIVLDTTDGEDKIVVKQLTHKEHNTSNRTVDL
jgi:hypothetical protein